MKKFFIVVLMFMVVALPGCGTGIKEKDIIKAIEKEELEIVGTYIDIDYRYLSTEEDKAERELKFRAIPTNIKILEKEKTKNGTEVKVSANLENQYFKLNKEQIITFQLSNQEGDIKVISSSIESGDMTVKPTLEFDMNMFYESEEKLRYFEANNEPMTVVDGEIKNALHGEWIELEIAKENVVKIEYDRNGEISKEDYTANENDFYYRGKVIFTLENGKEYKGTVEITYAPKEKEDWDKEPKFWISIGTVREIEKSDND